MLTARHENPHGGDIYGGDITLDFSASICPLGPPPAVLDAVRESIEQIACYPDPYCRELVQALSAHEALPASYFLCGNGAAELIDLWCRAVRVRHCAIPAPSFQQYAQSVHAAGGHVTYVPTSSAGFQLSWACIQQLSDLHVDAVILACPNNPTGFVLEAEKLRTLFAVCKRAHIRVLLDESFAPFCEDRPQYAFYLEDNPHLTLLRSFTKIFALPGLRLGYCVSADADLLYTMGSCVQPWNVSIPAQAAGVAALREDDYVQKARAYVYAQREVVTQALRRMELQVLDSSCNFLLFRAPQNLDRALRRRGLAVRNCAQFADMPAESGSSWYRIGLRTEKDNQILLQSIQACLQELPPVR